MNICRRTVICLAIVLFCVVIQYANSANAQSFNWSETQQYIEQLVAESERWKNNLDKASETNDKQDSYSQFDNILDTLRSKNYRSTEMCMTYCAKISKANEFSDTITALQTLLDLRECVYDSHYASIISPNAFGLLDNSSTSFFSSSSSFELPLFRNYTLRLVHLYPCEATAQFAYEALMHSKGASLSAENQFKSYAQHCDNIALQTYSNNLIRQQRAYHQWERQNNQKPFFERELCTRFDSVYFNDRYSTYAASLIDSISYNKQKILSVLATSEEYQQSIFPSWKKVQNQLGSNEVAIEFGLMLAEDYNDIYFAIVVSPEQEFPIIVQLCTAVDLDVLNCRREDGLQQLNRLIWVPIAKALGTVVKTVYFAADGKLCTLPIEAAVPDVIWHRMSSTRNLVTTQIEFNGYNYALLFGGLTYADTDEISDERLGVYNLANSKDEVDEISRLMFAKGITSKVVSGEEGTEQTFRNFVDLSPDIIHLSTHGFYWDSDKAEENSYVSFLRNDNSVLLYDTTSSLSHAGLYFSDVNKGLTGEEFIADRDNDGVLTATELSKIYLGDVDIVVLSACQTGLGDSSFEGVFGLQRGFKLAGANTLLMSLWNVNDEATKILMVKFYEYLLNGYTKTESLKKAQSYIREETEYKSPEYWAGWILLDALN